MTQDAATADVRTGPRDHDRDRDGDPDLSEGPDDQRRHREFAERRAKPGPRGRKPDHDGQSTRANPPNPPRRRVLLFVAIPVLGLLAWGAWSHWRTYRAADSARQQTADFVPQVRTAMTRRADQPTLLTLPGQTEPFDAANLFARATGFVAERRVDIGSRVHKGDLLLRIAAPDLDQQLVQAQAQLGQFQAALLQAQAGLQQAQANTKLADVTKARTTTLASQGWETRQNADNTTANAAVQAASVTTAQAGIAVADANLKAQQANIARLEALIDFENVRAPFDGIVTGRSVDVGNLLNADSSSGTPLFTLVRDDVLRVSVYVPQSAAVGLHDGLPADVRLAELPSRVVSAHVSRTAGSLDPASRSLLVQIDVDNHEHRLRAGLYANVTFAIPLVNPGVLVPDQALIFNAQGMQVGVVGQDGTVKLRSVTIGRDFGTTAEVTTGLEGGETVVVGAPVDMADGSKVRAAGPPEQVQATGE